MSAQTDRARLKAREALVKARTGLINHVRQLIKAFGVKLPACSSKCFHKRVPEHLPESLKVAVQPILESLGVISRQIYETDKALEKLAKERYPETLRLRQVTGVEPLLSLAFVLTLEDPKRFEKSRDVGAYLGLIPKQHQSGDHDPGLGISKQGDKIPAVAGHLAPESAGAECTVQTRLVWSRLRFKAFWFEASRIWRTTW